MIERLFILLSMTRQPITFKLRFRHLAAPRGASNSSNAPENLEKVMRILSLLLMFTFVQSVNAQNRIGTSPSDDYYLPNTIGIYSETGNTISTCTNFISDGVVTSLIPYQLTMQLRDPETLQFEVVNSFPVRKSIAQKDIALVLVGYGGGTNYPTDESFFGVAETSIDYLSKLSFGKISTYELFGGGIVEESGVYFSSLQDISSINDYALASPENFAPKRSRF